MLESPLITVHFIHWARVSSQLATQLELGMLHLYPPNSGVNRWAFMPTQH